MAAEETLRIALTDDASAPAGVAVDALDRLDKALEKLEGREIDVKTGGLTAAAFALENLKSKASQAGSALAAMNAGIDPGKMGAAIAAAQKLSSVFDLMKNRANEARAAEKRLFDEIEARGSKTPTALQAGAAPKAQTGFGQLLSVVDKLFGSKAAGGLSSGAASLVTAADKLGPAGPALLQGGKLLALGAAAVGVAAAALVAAAAVVAYKLLEAGLALSIASTSTRESFEASVKRFVGGAKEAHEIYQSAIKVAVDLSLDKEETLKKAKELASVGFKGAEVDVILRARADIAIVSEERANAFQKYLEKLKSGKAFTSIDELAEAGINAETVLKKLSEKLGVSVDKVKEQLKAGKIDVAVGIQAILAAAQGQYGGAAGNAADTIPAKVQSIKTLFESMFDSVDLSGIKAALDSVMKVFEGPAGEKFKGAVNKLFGTISDIFGKAFSGKEGEARLERFLTGITKLMEGASVIIESAGPRIIQVLDGISKIVDRNGSSTGGSWLQSIVRGVLELSDAIMGTDLAGFSDRLGGAVDGAVQAMNKAIGTAFSIGSDIIQGLINGIMNMGPNVASALGDVVQSAINKANKLLGRASPAKATIAMGQDTGMGMAIGLDRMRPVVAAAGGNMALAAMGAANDNAGASAGAAIAPAGGGAPGGSVTIVVQVTAGAGVTREQAQEAGDAAGEAAYQAWRRNMGRFVRDERRAA